MYSSIFNHLMRKDAPIPFALPEWIALAPFEEYLGMHIEQAHGGTAELTMPFVASHCQGAGLMHGGAIVALADTALAIAIKTVLPKGTHFATIDMSVRFHAPVKWGTVTAQAAITEQLDRDIRGEVRVLTGEGVHVATFQALFRIKRARLEESSDQAS